MESVLARSPQARQAQWLFAACGPQVVCHVGGWVTNRGRARPDSTSPPRVRRDRGGGGVVVDERHTATRRSAGLALSDRISRGDDIEVSLPSLERRSGRLVAGVAGSARI